jgi:hypothetical protein
MAEETTSTAAAATEPQDTSRTPDELALELMKFIAVSTGYGKGTSVAGFGGKAPRTAEEQADALIELFNRCRSVVRKEPK